MLTDIHAHLHTKDFDLDRDKVINKCEIVIVEAGVDLESDLKVLELSRKYSNILPAIGFHPEYIEKSEEVEKILKLLDQAKAISEVGLDYYWIKDQNLKKKEIEILKIFLKEGEKRKLPIIIHSRGGNKDLINLLPSYKIKFVLHAYEGSTKDAQKFIDMGGYISIPPILLRDKNRQEIVKCVPLESIVTETDSPFMGYEKNQRNEPCNVSFTIKKISEIKKIEEKEIEKKIEENFKKII
ncbi:TatD family hydrolase [Acidianus brierleyi]|uniref:TatD family hydrolase n=1 Tax=Acidianus brierleyi TaxID=41673 RepID=UPI00144334F1|nr:TatD family hydrolase [Acidianus brierleyi]AWR94707.2 TatD family deoxyribonuclease [Acidianus brierleyi]